MNDKKLVGLVVSTLDNSVKRAVGRSMAELEERFGLTPTQNFVLNYVQSCVESGSDVFQRDIEARFNIRRSTATGILQLMEKNGLITRQAIPSDARLKRIVVTPRGKEISDASRSTRDAMEAALLEGVAPEDLQVFLRVCETIGGNAKQIQ